MIMYKFWGKVRKNKQRGKGLGFPTANINLTKKIPEGIYVSYAKLGKSIYPALTFIGKAKTFDEKNFQAETYILDFNEQVLSFGNKDIYGQWISIRLLEKIRDNKKFNSARELITQMKKDEQKAREYFNQSS